MSIRNSRTFKWGLETVRALKQLSKRYDIDVTMLLEYSKPELMSIGCNTKTMYPMQRHTDFTANAKNLQKFYREVCLHDPRGLDGFAELSFGRDAIPVLGHIPASKLPLVTVSQNNSLYMGYKIADLEKLALEHLLSFTDDREVRITHFQRTPAGKYIKAALWVDAGGLHESLMRDRKEGNIKQELYINNLPPQPTPPLPGYHVIAVYSDVSDMEDEGDFAGYFAFCGWSQSLGIATPFNNGKKRDTLVTSENLDVVLNEIRKVNLSKVIPHKFMVSLFTE